MKALFRTGIASSVALLLAAIIAIPTFALTNPAFVCEIVADGIHATYSTSGTTCAGHTLVDANHQSMIMMIMGACDSTTVDYDFIEAAFNGDFATDYDWVVYEAAPPPVYAPADNRFGLGLVPCRKTGYPTNSSGSIYVKVPMASNTVFNKQATAQSADYANNAGTIGSTFQLIGADWHRAAVGAATRVDFNMHGGSNFVNKTKFAFFQE